MVALGTFPNVKITAIRLVGMLLRAAQYPYLSESMIPALAASSFYQDLPVSVLAPNPCCHDLVLALRLFSSH